MSQPTMPAGQPAVTNRGVVRPDDREYGGIDYLKLTVWATVEEVCDVLAGGVLDRYGWSTDPLNPIESWQDKACGGRAARILDAGCLCVVEFVEEVTQHETFCSVEIKGAGCDHLGNEGVRLILDDLRSRFRVRASRVDVMAHTEHFTPAMVRDAVFAGDYSSRSVTPAKYVFIDSADGDTCYLGVESKTAGGIKRCGDRMLSVYDRRGPTRIELQMSGDYAHGAGNLLAMTPIDEWPMLIRGLMRHYCDFIDHGKDVRLTRCPLLPWWEAFVSDAEKISVRSNELTLEGTPIGKVDGIFQRHAARLYAALEAYDKDWIIRRIEWHGKRRDCADHAELVTELRRYIGTGLAGVPEWEDEVPF